MAGRRRGELRQVKWVARIAFQGSTPRGHIPNLHRYLKSLTGRTGFGLKWRFYRRIDVVW